jgi:Zn-finger nucleic acid-binding protein
MQKTPHRKCPNCTGDMHVQSFAKHYRGDVDLDICDPCTLFWVDQGESSELAPASVVELFKLVHKESTHAPTPLKARLACPRCTKTLISTHDNVLGSRFHYYRCPQDHGRAITFTHFLVEKRFIREVSPVERIELAASIQNIRCEGCGASVDLTNRSSCQHCQAPIRVFDQNAAKRALEHYAQASKRASMTPAQPPVDSNADYLRERLRDKSQDWVEQDQSQSLVAMGIGALLGSLFT